MAQEQEIQAVGQSTEPMPQKKFYHKWWFWVIILLIAIGIAALFIFI